MQSVRSRQLLSGLSYDGVTYTALKDWSFPAGLTVEGLNAASAINANTLANSQNDSRLNTLLDKGTALDTISELQTAWDSGDSTLNTAITALTTSASTDRALIRSEFAVEDAALQSDIDVIDGLQTTHAGLHVAHSAALLTKSPAHAPTFTGGITINSTSIVGDSGTDITFNQTSLKLNTHASGSLGGTAFLHLATSIQPVADMTYDIGSGATRFREVYCKDCDSQQFLLNGVQLDKTHIGLDKVDNVSDADKPISTLAASKNTVTDAAVALNTSKISYSTAASSQVSTNKTDIASNVVAISANTPKISFDSVSSSQVSTNKTDIASNVVLIANNTAKVTYDGAVQVASNKNDIATNVVAIGNNTAKVTYDGAVQVASNKSDIATNVAAVTLNTLKVTYDGAVQVAANKSDIATNVVSIAANTLQTATNKTDVSTNGTAIGLNTVKVSYDGAVQVAANKSDIASNVVSIGSNVSKIALNTAKVTYDGAAQVATNKSDIATNVVDIASNVTKIALNTAKVTYDGAAQVATNKSGVAANVVSIGANTSQVASNVTKIGLNTPQVATNKTDIATNVSALADRLKSFGDQTMNGKLTVHYDGGNGCVANPHADDLQVYFYNDAGITIGCPQGKVGTLAFSDQNKADRNQIRGYSTVRDSRNVGMHFLADQLDSAVPSLSVTKTLVGINNAQPTYDLDVTGSARVTTNVFFTGLPTSDPGVVGQLWNDSGTLKISS